LEYIRVHAVFLSGAWFFLGHSQYQHTPLIQAASLTGVYGITFLIVLVNAAISEVIQSSRNTTILHGDTFAFKRVPLLPLGFTITLLIGTFLYRFFVTGKGVRDEGLSIAVLQTSLPRSFRLDRRNGPTVFNKHVELSGRARQYLPQLIVWPEGAIQGDVRHDPRVWSKIGQAASEAGTYLFVGGGENFKFRKEKQTGKYNSMFLISPTGEITGQYNKIRLFPFTEYEPLRGVVKWPTVLAASVNQRKPSKEFSIVRVGPAAFGTLICWESSFPEFARQFIKRGTRFLINAANESWPEGITASEHLLITSAFRGVENRVAVVRSTNFGISVFIDPFGRISQRIADPLEEGVLVGSITLSEKPTFYTRYGDIFAFSQLGFCALVPFYRLLRLGVPKGLFFW